MTGQRIHIGGPYFEDLSVGQVFDDAPALTLTSGHAALHEALFGDRLRLPLDATLSAAVTGREEPYAHPLLVCNVAIGQSTGPSQRVRGNLFYRGLVMLRPVFLGDTLRTSAKVAGLRQNRPRPGRPATGMVALKVRAINQRGEPVLDFWRCPMIPLRDPSAATGHIDSFDDIPAELDPTAIEAAVPPGWKLEAFGDAAGGRHFEDILTGVTYQIEGRDTVTSGPELARLTLNIAQTHADAHAGVYGRRLVYGGHTISMASAHVVRALPNLVTILAWRSCDHTGPVFEGDILRSEVTVEAKHPLSGGHGMLDLHAVVYATRGGDGPPSEDAGDSPQSETKVLDWRLIGLMA